MREADYIIVGAGSAGCILAERLSADPETTVIVLEAGGWDHSPWISVPLGYAKLYSNPSVTWQFPVAPDAELNNRPTVWPRGRVVGGSGSVNAMVYCRGLPGDFDDWAASGAEGWSWSDVKPVFEKLETRVSITGEETGDGPIHVQETEDQIHPLNEHYFAALKELGLPITNDMNGTNPEGGAVYNINTKDGQRCSSARACLRPALSRPNLYVRTAAEVKRLIVKQQMAKGVQLTSGETLFARREVILSAGAIGSPQLLQLSGIGPGKLLQKLNIPVLLDNSNVGAHLQDHIALNYIFKAKVPTLNSKLRSMLQKGRMAFQYALTRKGPLALSVNQCGGFLKSRPDLKRPDQQMYFNPVSYKLNRTVQPPRVDIDPFEGFIISAQPARPTSRGKIEINSATQGVAPIIDPNSLTTDEDRRMVIDGGKLCQRIMASKSLSAITDAPEEPNLFALDEQGLLEDFRDRASTVYHPVSTCRIGRGAATSVVDNRLKVHGINGLRVIDASAFPNITSGNTNAPTMMLALKGADIILEDHKRAQA